MRPVLRRVVASFALASVVALRPAEIAAQPSSPDSVRGRLEIVVDNDFFNFATPPRERPDDNYTHGIALRRTNLSVRSPFLRRLCGQESTCRMDLSLAQQMFTPEEDGAPPPSDLRPYAGTFVGRLELRSLTESRQRSVALNLGASGAPSGAASVQALFHEVFGFRDVQGWSYQVPFEPLVGFDVAAARAWGIERGDWGARLSPAGSLSLGNLRTGGRLDLGAEAGWSLDRPFGRAPGRSAFGVAVFAGAAADYRLHGVELDGSLLRASPQVASRDLVLRWQGGLRLRWRRLVVEHSLHAVSREVAAGRGQHVWGRLGVALWR